MSNKKHKKKHVEPEQPDLSHHAHAHDDDLVVVPVGQNKKMFFFIMFLMVFVLIIFTVGPYFQQVAGGVFGGGGGAPVGMSWVHPQTGETIEVGYRDFMNEKRALQRMAYIGLFRTRDPNNRNNNVTDEDTAIWLLYEQLAKDAGVEVTEAEVTEYLSAAFQGQQALYQQAARNMAVTPRQIKDEARRFMRASRYQDMLRRGYAIADPAEVTRLWNEQNEVYGFEYVQLDAADYVDEAKSRKVSNEELLEWLHAKPDFEQKKYHTEDKKVVEAAWITLDADFDQAALLAAHPLPEDWNAEEQARSYYNQFSNVRFQKEASDEEPAEDAGEDAEPADERLYEDFETVKEQCLAEAPIYRALSDWLASVQTRIDAGETVDLGDAAVEIGAKFELPETPLGNDELETRAGWGGKYTLGQLSFARAGTFVGRVVVEEDAFVVLRVARIEPGSEPPIAEIRDDLFNDWAKEEAANVAVAKLEALRDSFGDRPGADESADEEETEGPELPPEPEEFLPTTTSETFRSVCEAAGFEVVTRPYLARHELPDDDFDNASAADMFIRVTAPLFELEPGQVPEAQKNFQGTHAFLVRFVDQKPKDITEMKPENLLMLRREVITDSMELFADECLTATSDYIKERYALQLASWEEEAL